MPTCAGSSSTVSTTTTCAPSPGSGHASGRRATGSEPTPTATAPATGEPLADHPCLPDTGTASGYSDLAGPSKDSKRAVEMSRDARISSGSAKPAPAAALAKAASAEAGWRLGRHD